MKRLDTILRDWVAPLVFFFISGFCLEMSIGLLFIFINPDIPEWGVLLLTHTTVITILILAVLNEIMERG